MRKAFLDPLPRGYTLDEQEWQRRHRLLLTLLTGHVPALAVVGGLLGNGIGALLAAITVPAACAALGLLLRHRRRVAAITVTLGLVYCSAALVGLTSGAVEAHFHFFVIIGFIALYQDWVPLVGMILFTTISHVAGSYWKQDLVFSHAAGQANPWLWSFVHGVAVLAACVGVLLLWNLTEGVQEKITGERREADAEVGKQRFTRDLLVNLARRNQSMLYRQLEIINRLEESERDPDTLSELFALDHLATRVRRNAESLLVLSGEQPQRVWTQPVPLRDVLRAAIAETEDLDRVVFVADEELAVAGHTVTDLTHLIAELTENAVRFSPPDSTVSIRANPNPRVSGGYAVTVEDWGVGMPAEALAAANELLARPPDVDLSVAHQLGFHVVARLASRHYIVVSLSATPSSGITATVLLPPTLFTGPTYDVTEPVPIQRPLLDDPTGSAVGATAGRPIIPAARGSAAVGAMSGGPSTVWTMPGGPSVGPAKNGSGANGSGANGSGANGSGANGSGANGPTVNGSGASGSMTDGSAANGSTTNESTANGSGANGLKAGASAPNGTGNRPEARPEPRHREPVVPAIPAAVVPVVEPSPIGFPVISLTACPPPVILNGTPVADTVPVAHTATPAPAPAPAAAPAPEQRPTATPEERWPGWWAAEVEGVLPEPSSYGSAGYGTSEPLPAAPAPRTGSSDRGPLGKNPPGLVPSPRPRTATADQLPPQSDRRAVETQLGGSQQVGPQRVGSQRVEPRPVAPQRAEHEPVGPQGIEPLQAEVCIDPVSGLRRRIPQTHLAPGLRQSGTSSEPPDPRSPRDPGGDAADALSRYQASRQAARTVVEDGHRWAR